MMCKRGLLIKILHEIKHKKLPQKYQKLFNVQNRKTGTEH